MKQALWFAGMFLASALQAAPELPAMPTAPDIRANVLQLLEQGRQDGRSIVILDADGEPVAAPLAGDLFQQWGEGQRDEAAAIDPVQPRSVKPSPPAPDMPREVVLPSPIQQPAVAEPVVEEEHLHLPSREITISGPEDLKRLLQTFDAAREAQQDRRK